jgi:hypothetical protein
VEDEAPFDFAAYVSARCKKLCLKVADGSGTGSSLHGDDRSKCSREENDVPSCSSVRFCFYRHMCNVI